MAASTDTFRTSLHGFNRTDVVQFIQKMTTAHEKELRLLQEENERLRQEAELLRGDAARLQMRNATLKAQLDQAEQPSAAAPGPASPPESAPAPVSPASEIAGEELAAYRRAEVVERKARERAEATTRLLKDVFAKANERLNDGGEAFSDVMNRFREDYERLQQLLAEAKSVFDASSDELKAAGDALDET